MRSLLLLPLLIIVDGFVAPVQRPLKGVSSGRSMTKGRPDGVGVARIELGVLSAAADDEAAAAAGDGGPISSAGVALSEGVLKLRGAVASGYGRGSRKLGFPTANLPSSLFGEALADWPAGVYFGFAVVEPPPPKTPKKRGEEEGEEETQEAQEEEEALRKQAMRGFGVIQQAVVNVGYSPTFEGEENREKIVEAHIIKPAGNPFASAPSSSKELQELRAAKAAEEAAAQAKALEEGAFDGDFYGGTMTLVLVGSLRPEMKFPAFPALVAQIGQDVADAAAALDAEPFRSYPKADPFLHAVLSPLPGTDPNAQWEKKPFNFTGLLRS